MKKLSLSAFLFICVFTKLAGAQGGYVINQKNDTIRCYEVKTNSFDKVKFKVKAKDAIQTAYPDVIKEFQTSSDSSIFVAKRVFDTVKGNYLKWIERGRINFYKIISRANDYYWYASKNNDSLHCLRIDYYKGVLNSGNKKLKKIFIEMISDQPALLAEFKANNDYDADTIQTVIANYNIAAAAGKK